MKWYCEDTCAQDVYVVYVPVPKAVTVDGEQ